MNKKLLFWLQVASSMKFFFLQLKTFKTRIFVFRKCWCILRNIIFLYSRIWLFGVWLMNGCQHLEQVHVYMMFPVTHVKLSFTVKHWTRLKENYDPLADGDTYNILSYFTFYYERRNYCLVYTVFSLVVFHIFVLPFWSLRQCVFRALISFCGHFSAGRLSRGWCWRLHC